MTDLKLTEMELVVLEAGCNSEYESINGGIDWVFAIIENSELEPSVARGVIASLVKKGLVTVQEDTGDMGQPQNIIYCTKLGERFCNSKGWRKA